MTNEDRLDPLRGVRFRKSTYSDHLDECVEVGRAETAVGFQDSKQAVSPIVAVSVESGRAFFAAVKNGEFGQP